MLILSGYAAQPYAQPPGFLALSDGIDKAVRQNAKLLANEALVHARATYWRHVNSHGCRPALAGNPG